MSGSITGGPDFLDFSGGEVYAIPGLPERVKASLHARALGTSAAERRWGEEGTALGAQPPGGELARRLAESDLGSLTPAELVEFGRAASRLSAWADGLSLEARRRACRGSGARP